MSRGNKENDKGATPATDAPKASGDKETKVEKHDPSGEASGAAMPDSPSREEVEDVREPAESADDPNLVTRAVAKKAAESGDEPARVLNRKVSYPQGRRTEVVTPAPDQSENKLEDPAQPTPESTPVPRGFASKRATPHHVRLQMGQFGHATVDTTPDQPKGPPVKGEVVKTPDGKNTVEAMDAARENNQKLADLQKEQAENDKREEAARQAVAAQKASGDTQRPGVQSK